MFTHFVCADLIDGEELIDPTRPLFQNTSIISDQPSVVDTTGFELTFVRAGSTSPIAVINKQQVRLGDVIGGALVFAIDRNGVTLLRNNEEIRINVHGTGIKAPVAER